MGRNLPLRIPAVKKTEVTGVTVRLGRSGYVDKAKTDTMELYKFAEQVTASVNEKNQHRSKFCSCAFTLLLTAYYYEALFGAYLHPMSNAGLNA